MATLFLTIGVPAVYTLAYLRDLSGMTSDANYDRFQSVLPTGVVMDSAGMSGAPEDFDTPPYKLAWADSYNSPLGTLDIAEEVLTITLPAPAAEGTDDGYVLPEVAGARWLVDGVDTAPGAYSVQPVTEVTTVTIVPEALEGYVFDPEAVPLVLTFDPAAEPEPEPDPIDPAEGNGGPGPAWPAPATPAPTPETEAEWAALLDDDPQAVYVAQRLSARVIAHTGGGTGAAEIELASTHVMTILEYVRGYTRDRGFSGYIPHRSLAAVIVAAASRLYVNPEQLTYYQTGDYSERPATMAGWTIAELGVLRRFRRVFT